ncbi:hypothetical protein [Streptomyces spinosus]|uniref:hypothetical protein n=1 Tax=Streptomyces spinosus TaxID=2872623 RepID=UPI001CEC84A6|nr:hypothetical protein [Streptomyces spinosus]
MSQAANELSRAPTPDPAEDDAYFPSPYSLSQYTSSKTDFDGVQHRGAYTQGKWKVLMIATEERYVLLENGKMFSTGNHPVEMLLPLHHVMEAGFDVDIATLEGYPAKLELWAMPREDEAVMGTYEVLRAKLKQPEKLSEVVAKELGEDSDYIAVFIPGGHGAVVGLPASEAVSRTLEWALCPTTSSSSPCATARRRCSLLRWAGTSRCSRGIRSASSPTHSTRGRTSRSAIFPAACPGWWPIC